MLQDYRLTFMELAKEKMQLEHNVESLKRTSKNFGLVLDNTTAFLKQQSEKASETLKYDLAWFKSMLGSFALILIFVLGLRGILIIRKLTKTKQ